MLRFRKGFSYTENATLTGKKMIAGDPDSNTYIYIKKEAAENFKSVVEKINKGLESNTEKFSMQERLIVKQLDEKGFFENSTVPKGSFNEVNSFSKIFYKKIFSSSVKGNGNRIITNILFLITIAAMGIYIMVNRDYLDNHIDISTLSVPIVFTGVIVIPVLIDFFHETGHYIVARLLRVPVATFQIGFFIIHPIIYFTYKGLNLQTTLTKVSILLGGIAGHMAGAILGIILLKCNINSVFIDVWILCNISMILTSLSVLGVSDGYFMISTLLGIYNFRLYGYKAIKKIMNHRNVDNREKINGLIISSIWILSLGGLYKNIELIAKYILLSEKVTYMLSFILILFLFVRLIWKISKVQL